MTDPDLLARVEALERTVAELQAQLHATRRTHTPPSHGRASDQTVVAEPPPAEPRLRRRWSIAFLDRLNWTSEDVLKWFGLGLLLLGVAFLFVYAIDQGWLTPGIRIAFGLGLGLGMVVLGQRIRHRRPEFGQALQGGGLAVFYITLFAAYQVLRLFSYPVAFGGMVAVTFLALGLAVRQNGPVLAVIGLLGGLATPFLLYTSEANITGLVAYTCLLLAGTSLIYLFWGWRSLLYASVIGGWLVLGLAVSELPYDTTLQAGDRVAVQLGIVWAVLAFWVLPLIRAVLHTRAPDRWPVPAPDIAPRGLFGLIEGFSRQAVHQVSLTTPLIGLTMTNALWHFSGAQLGALSLALTVLFAAASLWLYRQEITPLGYTHAATATLLLTLALVLFLDGHTLFFVLAAEAGVLHAVAHRLSDRRTHGFAHFLFVIVAFWLLQRLTDGRVEASPVLNAGALTDLVVIGIGLGASYVLRSVRAAQVYRVLAHLAVLAWFARAWMDVPNGAAYVTVAWSLYGIALLVLGLWTDRLLLRRAGLFTLGLVVVKLFLVDLAELDALWRILLFLGIGGLFLVLGYFVPGLWRPAQREAEVPNPAAEPDPS